MKTKKAQIVNLLNESYSGPTLPQNWQVIYHEGVRGNHILFEASELASFSDDLKTPLDKDSEERLIDAVVRLFSCAGVIELKKYIGELTRRERSYLFGIYLHMLNQWRAYSVAQLH